MKYIKGMVVLSDYLFWLVVRRSRANETNNKWSARDKASEASYRHQSNDFCGGKTSAD